MYLGNPRHILIQDFYVRMAKTIVTLVSVIVCSFVTGSLPTVFTEIVTWTLANIILQMPLLRTVPLAVTWHL